MICWPGASVGVGVGVQGVVVGVGVGVGVQGVVVGVAVGVGVGGVVVGVTDVCVGVGVGRETSPTVICASKRVTEIAEPSTLASLSSVKRTSLTPCALPLKVMVSRLPLPLAAGVGAT
jgi:hypothetical protein